MVAWLRRSSYPPQKLLQITDPIRDFCGMIPALLSQGFRTGFQRKFEKYFDFLKLCW
jgi:hypothetical protein